MDIRTDSRHVSRLEIVDTGRRRRWSDAEKLRIVEESFSGPRLVSSTARRNGISNALLFAWRKAYRAGQLGDVHGFVPAVVAPGDGACEPPMEKRRAPSPDVDRDRACRGRMVIVLSGTRRVIVGSDVDTAALRRVLDVLERPPVCRSSQSEGR
jgi:transposase